MTEKVGRLLAPHGLKAGNDPLGAFAYSLGDDEPFPKVRSSAGWILNYHRF